MKVVLLRILKILGIVVAMLLVLVVTIGILLNTSAVQNKLMSWATEELSEKLHTQVTIEKVDVDFLTYDIRLHGLEVLDQQHEKMLKLERLAANVKLWPLLHREVIVSSVGLTGLHARLYQTSPDSAANYQFILDAFKKEKKDSTATDTIAPRDSSGVKKEPMRLDLQKVTLERISVEWTHFKKKGPEDITASLARLVCKKRGDKYRFDIDGLRFANDNRLPRKNAGKPKRGAFDATHLDITADMELTAQLLAKDSVFITLHHLEANDTTAGLMLQELTLTAAATPRCLHLKDVALRMDETTLHIDSAYLQLPSKKQGRQLAYSTSPIEAHVLLKEIAKPFAPVLSNFTIPLTLKVLLSGDHESMHFKDILVTTLDKKLEIAANGQLHDLNDKYKLALRFDVSRMKAQGGVKEKIISQFPVKKLMMKQLHALGTITYRGKFNILYQREEFFGRLDTQIGHLNFNFALDEANKYVVGGVNTKNLLVGQAFDMQDLGNIVGMATFKIDISKPRTAKMRRLKGGKLPIGNVNAIIDECHWKKVTVRNLTADIVSDGAVAEGNVTVKGKRTDLLCSFSFTSTDSIKKKLKVKPGIRFHGLSDEDKVLKAEKKAQKAQEKAERKAQKEKEKAEKRALKEQERAREAEEKALRKAEKARRKAEKKAAKEAAKKAAKESVS